MQRPKVSCKFLLLLRSNVLEILVTENHDAPLSNQQRQLILLRVVQLRELKSSNLGSNHWGELGHLEVGVAVGQKSRLGLVCCETPIRELERLDRAKVSLLIIDGKIVMVFVLSIQQVRRTAEAEG